MAFDLTATLRIIDKTTAPLRSMASGLASAVTKVGALSGAMLGIAGVAGAAAVAFKSVEKAMSFESQMSTIKALTGATADEMAKMQTLALKMGASTKYSAMEAAQGIEELLKAGISPAAVQAGGLEAALNLATAGGLDLAAASEIMSTALNSFKKDGLSASEAANILAGTANASATSVEELRFSLSSVGSVADGVGLSFKDTNIAMGLFANNGIKGSDAGTSFKSMLMNLSPATKKAREGMFDLGIMTETGSNAFFTASGELESLDTIANVLQKSLKKLTAKDRQDALRDMFGTDGIRAGNILYKEGAAGVKKFREEMSKVTALDVAKQKMDNAAGAVEQFKGALETLQISALLPTMPLIKKAALAAADMVEKYTPQITAAVQDMTDKATKYIGDHFTNNPEFTKLSTFSAKVDFIFKDVVATFNGWWDSTGKGKLEAISSTVTKSMVDAMAALAPEFADVGLKIGSAIGSGVWDGLSKSKAGKLLRMLSPDWMENLASGQVNVGQAALDFLVPDWSPVIGDAGKPKEPIVPYTAPNMINYGKLPTNAFNKAGGIPKLSGGISRVPYNGMPAILHRDETVLPRGEARSYRNNSGSGGVNISGNTFNVREEADIEKVAAALYRMIDGANNAIATGGAH